MVVYSIKDVENLCGIKAHTLRIWEKRYGILITKRTRTNIRYYTEEDLKYALNLSILYRKGMKISKLAELSKAEIRNKVAEITEIDDAFEKSLDTLSISMLELDEYKFNKILNKNINQKGFDETMDTVIYPLLEKINMMWMAGSINEVHEAFVLNIIRNKVVVQIDSLPINKDQSENTFLLYLPEQETEKLSLFYMHYLLKKEGFTVYFLGDDVNFQKLKSGVDLYKPTYIFTIINDAFSEESMKPYINKIEKEIPGILILSGYQAVNQGIEESYKRSVLSSLEEVLKYLTEVKEMII